MIARTEIVWIDAAAALPVVEDQYLVVIEDTRGSSQFLELIWYDSAAGRWQNRINSDNFDVEVDVVLWWAEIPALPDRSPDSPSVVERRRRQLIGALGG